MGDYLSYPSIKLWLWGFDKTLTPTATSFVEFQNASYIRREGSTLFVRQCDFAPDDLFRYDVTIEPVRELSMPAKI